MSRTTRRAWITLITRTQYLAGLLCLYRTLKAVSKYPLVVMVTDTLPKSGRKIITDAGLEIVDVGHLAPSAGQHPGFDPAFLRLNDAWTKLQVFGLTQFDQVALIDSDMIFLRGMDEIFDIELDEGWIAASPACICNPLKLDHYPKDWIPANCALSKQSRFIKLDEPPIPNPDGPRTAHLLNSGLVVLRPSSKTMHSLVEYLHSSPSIANAKFADQDVIAEAFHGKWRPLPWWCNALKTQRAVHPDMWADTEVRLIHYILDKPWTKRPDFQIPSSSNSSGLPNDLVALVQNSPPQKSLTDYPEVHAWWWAVYDEVLKQYKGVEDVDQWPLP